MRSLILPGNVDVIVLMGVGDWSTAADRALNPYKLPTKVLPSSVGGEGDDGSAAAAALSAAEERKHLCLHRAALLGFPACLLSSTQQHLKIRETLPENGIRGFICRIHLCWNFRTFPSRFLLSSPLSLFLSLSIVLSGLFFMCVCVCFFSFFFSVALLE